MRLAGARFYLPTNPSLLTALTTEQKQILIEAADISTNEEEEKTGNSVIYFHQSADTLTVWFIDTR